MRVVERVVADVVSSPLLTSIRDWSRDNEMLTSVAIALIILVGGWYGSKLVVRLAGRTVAQRIERPSVTRSVLRTIRLSVLLVSFMAAALVLGIGNVEILLSVGVLSAVVAVVLAPLIGSLIHGLFILTDKPFEIGDMIEIVDQDHVGFVEDITIRYTKIVTLENTILVVPNSDVHERDVLNYSAEDERTRVSIEYDVTYESDLDQAIRDAERAARSVDEVVGGGPDVRVGSARYTASPLCDVKAYADSGVRLVLRFWVKEPYKLTRARSIVAQRVRERYADTDVQFAYPHRELVFNDAVEHGAMQTDTPTRSRDAERADSEQ
ncbi:mechanosensitive ion channel MscS [Halovivax asiaticus JCM 14624]|uniref:Mechanosensitive ion channel MscS n=1 Tax=Halovivax asiaticus JCM 14624 TaxID=1227490 RepID=M0BR44_9EURY|nr:mechanosensitive ion channel family protein [Halovivax asiaticus]ELZ13415.1 mechanosensitive ion channel MscS [Halovivax asiaticus JCM 14624]